MLELRITVDAKRIASLRDAIRRECGRARADPEHTETVALVAAQLLDERAGDGGEARASRRGRRGARPAEVLVVVTVQSDATMLMLRDPRPEQPELGERRGRVLQQHTTRWSTMCGRDGRTIWAEIARVQPCASPDRPGPVRLPCAP